MRTSLLWSLTLSMTLGLLAGCSDENHGKEDALNHTYRLIDEQRDDEAIQFMDGTIRDQQNQDLQTPPEYTVALASAYAHKAGIRIQQFVGIIDASKKMSSVPDAFKKVLPEGSDPNSRLDFFLTNSVGLMTKFSAIFEIYTTIPSLHEADQIYLQQAISLMESVGDARPENAVYRAVLRIVQFKYLLSMNLLGNPASGVLTKNCTVDVSKIQATLNRFEQLADKIIHDFTIAAPAQQSAMDALRDQIKAQIQALTSAMSWLTVSDEPATMLFKRRVIEEGFGKLIQCKAGPS